MSFILFDVGANWGSDSLPRCMNDPDCIVFAFEPNPKLAQELKAASVSFADRYHVFCVAVSDYDGQAIFHLANHADSGVSSLLNFAPNIKDTWGTRADLYFDEDIQTQVIRLDTFLDTTVDLSRIDYLHIDAQGSDLAVLRGLGKYLSFVQRGVIEIPQSSTVPLYAGQHTREEAIAFLRANRFFVTDERLQQNEANLYFI